MAESSHSPKAGDRIELIYMDDPRPMEPGSQGTVIAVDSLGTIHVKWDNGRTLGLLSSGEDDWRII